MPLYKSVYARITPDSNDLMSSTFSAEMTEMAYILKSLDIGSPSNSNSSNGDGTRNETTPALVIIDELGRGSSVADGLAISLAVTDALLTLHHRHNHKPSTEGLIGGANRLKPTVFLCTHFQELPNLLGERAGVAALQMKVNVSFSMTLFGILLPCEGLFRLAVLQLQY